MLGQFAPSVFFKTSVVVIIPTLFVIYWISQWLGHQKPFPNCWISKVAQHYPEFVFFRIATIGGPVLLILGWMTNNFYLRTIGKEHVFRVKKYHPEVASILGIMGALLLMGNTATIDTGKMNTKWHTNCATTFFIFTLVAQVYNTIIYWLIYNQIKVLNYLNLLYKTFIMLLLGLQLVYSSIGFEEQSIYSEDGGLSSKGIFLQWSLTATVIIYFHSMSIDVQKFKYVYEFNSQSQNIQTLDQIQ